ncbi:MAG: hypothetical protein V4718_18085 [Pseudomonadota bacterium]
MNSKLIASAVIALSALTGASAFAQSSLNPEAALAIQPVASTSSLTRAEVQNMNTNPGQNGDFAAEAFARSQQVTSAVSRDYVRNEAVMAAHANVGGNSSI